MGAAEGGVKPQAREGGVSVGLAGRFFRSLRERGVRETARRSRRRIAILSSKALDAYFDLRHGTETRHFVMLDEQRDVTSPNHVHGVRYEPTRARPLRRLLRELPAPRGGVFVDIGCGKGRALMVAAETGFRRLVGVDYSSELCRIARRNLERFARARGGGIAFEVNESDAADFAFAPDHDVIYLFNPFDLPVVRSVLDRLEDSLRAHPRKAWLIYTSPVWHEEIEGRAAFACVARRVYGGYDFAVYVTPSPAPVPDPR